VAVWSADRRQPGRSKDQAVPVGPGAGVVNATDAADNVGTVMCLVSRHGQGDEDKADDSGNGRAIMSVDVRGLGGRRRI